VSLKITYNGVTGEFDTVQDLGNITESLLTPDSNTHDIGDATNRFRSIFLDTTLFLNNDGGNGIEFPTAKGTNATADCTIFAGGGTDGANGEGGRLNITFDGFDGINGTDFNKLIINLAGVGATTQLPDSSGLNINVPIGVPLLGTVNFDIGASGVVAPEPGLTFVVTNTGTDHTKVPLIYRNESGRILFSSVPDGVASVGEIAFGEGPALSTGLHEGSCFRFQNITDDEFSLSPLSGNLAIFRLLPKPIKNLTAGNTILSAMEIRPPRLTTGSIQPVNAYTLRLTGPPASTGPDAVGTTINETLSVTGSCEFPGALTGIKLASKGAIFSGFSGELSINARILGGTEDLFLTGSNVIINSDSFKLFFGAEAGTLKDSSVGWDGTDLVADPTLTLGTGAFRVDGPVRLTEGLIEDVTTVTTAITLDHTQKVVHGNNASTPFIITIPSAASHSGRVYEIKNINAAIVTVGRTGSDTFDGSVSVDLNQFDALRFRSTGGTVWHIS